MPPTSDAQLQTVETRYVFRFVAPDGVRYVRHVYWETLYAVGHGDGEILAASRAVPLNDALFAFYAALRDAFMDGPETPLLADPDAGIPARGEDEAPAGLVPPRFPDMLALALREQDELPSAPIRKLAAEYSSMRPGPPPPALQPYVAAGLPDAGRRNEAPLPPVPMIPPALRRYLRGRYARLGEVVARYEAEEDLDPRFHRERMAALIGRAEAKALGTS
jgi:hypothetical protein